MSWWWVPIADGAGAESRQFQIQDFLHQVIDILNACVPLYNWYVDDASKELDLLGNLPEGQYVVGTTNAQGIWPAIQARIEILVGFDVSIYPHVGPVFYDFESLATGDWFASGSEDGPRAAPRYMNYNVYKRFKTLARAVSGIPTDHLIRQEDVAATAISAEIDTGLLGGYVGRYTFPDDIAGFKWDSVSVDSPLAQTYYENVRASGPEPEPGYYIVQATGERSQDGTIYFSREQRFSESGTPVTIRYNVDTTGFGWTRRIDDDTVDPPYAYEGGASGPGHVIHACLLNQIYACTVVLQDFAVLVSGSHSNVPGETMSDKGKHWETSNTTESPPSEYYCADDDGPPFGEDFDVACEKARVKYMAGPTDSAGAGTTCGAGAEHYGGDACQGWSGTLTQYTMKLTNLPVTDPATDLNIKEFPVLNGPIYGAYTAGVFPFAAQYIIGAEFHKVKDILETDANTATWTAGEPRGDGENPVTVSVIDCDEDGSGGLDFWDNYTAVGWVCIQKKIPNPTSEAP